MTTHRKYNWPELLTNFENSNLTQAAFCQQHNLNPKYFNQKWITYRKAQSSFQKVTVDIAQSPSAQLVIRIGRCHIVCPDSMLIESFTSLVHKLA